MEDLTPMDTFYDGRFFRSRTEARWALFFNVMGWNYEYEYETFILPSGPYLPDFYLPDLNVWCEVKPGKLSSVDLNRCTELSDMMNSNSIGVDVLLLEGMPKAKPYNTIINGRTGLSVLLVGKNECYYPFFQSEAFNKRSHFLDQTELAVKKSSCARFEYEWKERGYGS